MLSGELEEWLARTLSPTLVWDHPTIHGLARFLAGEAMPGPAAVLIAVPGCAAVPIAIVGRGCRFPGAADPDAFWSFLRSGGDAIREVPPIAGCRRSHNRIRHARHDDDRFGGFRPASSIEIRASSASRRARRATGPQQRLSWRWRGGPEHAGSRRNRVGTNRVFVGISTNDYAGLQFAILALGRCGDVIAHSVAATASYLSTFAGRAWPWNRLLVVARGGSPRVSEPPLGEWPRRPRGGVTAYHAQLTIAFSKRA